MVGYVKPNGADEEVETSEEENAESPTVEKTEQEAGTEKPQADVKVPEAFQQACVALISNANLSQLNYLRDEIMQRESALRKAETKQVKSQTFDTEGMPD